MNGKGDKDNRITDRQKYRKNFDSIFPQKIQLNKPLEYIEVDVKVLDEDGKEVDKGISDDKLTQ